MARMEYPEIDYLYRLEIERETSMSETAETYNLEIDSIKKEGRDLLIAYEIASATERQTRDAFLAWCRDHLHNYLKQIGYGDPREVHIVLDMIDEFLNRAGGRRK